MRNFMVMVNRKFMVKVQAESACAAEHKILDGIYVGIQTALAFDREDMKGDYFQNCLMDCETISYAELDTHAHILAHIQKHAEEQRANICAIDEEIARLCARIEELNAEKAAAEAQLDHLKAEAEDANAYMGASREFGTGYVEV